MYTVIDENNNTIQIEAESASEAALKWIESSCIKSNVTLHQTLHVISPNNTEEEYLVAIAIEVYKPEKNTIIYTSVQ